MRQKTICSAWITAALLTFSAAAESTNRFRVVFLGDSLTSGYTLDADLAYPALIQNRIDAAGLPFTVLNSGVSADTTAGGLSRLNWLLRQRVDVLVVALGANDGLRAFDPAVPRRNLTAIIETTRERQPHCAILLAGMKLPRNMGDDYVAAFETIFPDLAAAYDLPLLPFLLEGVAGNPDLNMPDGIHPTAEGQRIIADQMWTFLEPTLRRVAAQTSP